jgi:hypothetical protein
MESRERLSVESEHGWLSSGLTWITSPVIRKIPWKRPLTTTRRKAKMNNIEAMMAELAKSSVDLKRELYRRDDAAATSPEGIDGPRIEVHTCRLCDRSAVGEGAHVRHKSGCALAKLQKAQKALREAWPELFARKPAPEGKHPHQVRART